MSTSWSVGRHGRPEEMACDLKFLSNARKCIEGNLGLPDREQLSDIIGGIILI
jgi:hypothetical protein